MSVREIELPTRDLTINQDSELENDAGAVVWDAVRLLSFAALLCMRCKKRALLICKRCQSHALSTD